MRIRSLHVPAPCAEPWNGMTPEAGGRSCARCGHTVADLTSATDAELVAVFSGGNAPKCARFDPAQLDRALRPERPRRALIPVAAFTSLLAIACGTETIGEAVPRQDPVAVDTPQVHTDTPVIGDTVVVNAPDTLDQGFILGEVVAPKRPAIVPPEQTVVGAPLPTPVSKEEEDQQGVR